MILSSVLFFLVAGTISTATSANNTYTRDSVTDRLILADGAECERPGKMCDTCQKVVYCVEIGGGNYIKQEMYDCSSGQTCLSTINDCSVEPNPKCDAVVPKYKFVCHQTGMFPDAEDCTKYHICVSSKIGESPVKPEPYSGQCDAGYSYDPFTTLCRNKIIPEKPCKPPAPLCKVAGESGIIPDTLGLYYICLRLNGLGPYFPQMFACPRNQEFYNGGCVDRSFPPGLNADGNCIANGYIEYPESCLQYYNCKVNTKPTIANCAVGAFFNFRTRICTTIACSHLK